MTGPSDSWLLSCACCNQSIGPPVCNCVCLLSSQLLLACYCGCYPVHRTSGLLLLWLLSNPSGKKSIVRLALTNPVVCCAGDCLLFLAILLYNICSVDFPLFTKHKCYLLSCRFVTKTSTGLLLSRTWYYFFPEFLRMFRVGVYI